MKDNELIFKNISGSIDDVFFNDFDRTWLKSDPNGPEPDRVYTKLPIEVAYDDGNVLYEYNKDFFRCDNFTDKHNGPHILFAGCSESEGVGAPIDTVWTKVLLSTLGKDLGFYSIARAGFGWQKVITNFMVYVEKYGVPSYLFILLPNIGRFFEWDNENNKFLYVQRYPNNSDPEKRQTGGIEMPTENFKEEVLTKQEHRRSFVDFAISWKLFEKYCEAIGTKMIWSSWDYEENKNYEISKVSKNYIPLSQEGLFEFIKSKRPDGKMDKFDISRRDGHGGILVNEYWAMSFKAEFDKRGWSC
jgi:hypothetical protein